MDTAKTIKKIVREIWFILEKKQRYKMVGMVFVITIGSFFELLGVTSMLPFIQAMMTPEELMQKPIMQLLTTQIETLNKDNVIIFMGIGIIIIYITKNVYLAGSSYLQIKYSNDTRRKLSVMMLNSYLYRPYSYIVEKGSGVLMRGVGDDVEGVYSVILYGFQLLSDILVTILISSYLFVADFYLALSVIVVGIICIAIIVIVLKNRLSDLSVVYRAEAAKQRKWLFQIINGIKDILIMDRRDFFLDRYDDAYKKSNDASIHYNFMNALPKRIIEGVCVSGIIIAVLLRLNMNVDENTFIPKLSVFAMGAFRLLPSISNIAGHINSFMYYRNTVDSTYENVREARRCINEVDVLRNENNSTNSKKDIFQNEIEIKNISWKYDNSDVYVLKDVSLSICFGDAVGIMGESGSGKSTFADLLMQLYKVKEGVICVDGVNINLLLGDWSKIVSYVPQAVFLMDSSIKDNIIFGSNIVDENEIWNALKKASMDEYVKKLPDQLETRVGEHGVMLSGGQRQRLAIARALYLNPKILILDEATSALDNDTEEAVMEAIENLVGTVTLIIIAHRLSTLKKCNRIYEVRDKRLIEKEKSQVLVDWSGINE